jgi:tetratricopeptide (TPR) repeat protein
MTGSRALSSLAVSRLSASYFAILFFLLSPSRGLAQSKSVSDARGSLSGTVLIDGENVAASQVRVELRGLGQNGNFTVLTDRQGDFRVGAVPAGTYYVTVNAPGYSPFEETLQIDPGTTPLVVRLRRMVAVLPRNTAPSISAHELNVPVKARKYFDKGNQLLAAKNVAGSIPEYQRAIKTFPAYYEAYYKIGIAELNQQHGVEAEAAFRKALELSQAHYAPAQSGLSLVLCIERHFTEAEAAARADLELDPNDSMGHYALALVLYATDRIGESEKSAHDVLRIKSTFPEANLLLAQVHARQNNPAAVVADLDAYLKLDSVSPRADNARAVRAGAQNALLQQSASAAIAKANP